MKTACPSCSAYVEVTEGQLTSCPSCGHWWVPKSDVEDAFTETEATDARVVVEQPFEFELQLADGDRWEGPFDRFNLREMVYTERLTGDERLRVPGQPDSERLRDRPEFAEVLQLLGKQEASAPRKSSIAGWKKGGAVAEAAEKVKAEKEAERRREVEARIKAKEGPNRNFVIGGAVTIGILLVLLVLTLVFT